MCINYFPYRLHASSPADFRCPSQDRTCCAPDGRVDADDFASACGPANQRIAGLPRRVELGDGGGAFDDRPCDVHGRLRLLLHGDGSAGAAAVARWLVGIDGPDILRRTVILLVPPTGFHLA